GEIELPGAAEGLVEAVPGDLRPLSGEGGSPSAQRLGVVLAELVHLGDAQVRVSSRRRLDRTQGGDQASGEDVLLDPAIGVAGGEIAVVAHQDGLDRCDPSWGEPSVEDLEVRGPV